MAATCAASAVAASKTTVTGSGYVGAEVRLVASFVSTDGKRRYIESYRIPVAAGNISYSIPVPLTGGTLSVKATDIATGAVLASATNVSV